MPGVPAPAVVAPAASAPQSTLQAGRPSAAQGVHTVSATHGVSAPEVAVPAAGTSLSALLVDKLSAARGAHAVPAMPGMSAPVVVAAVASSSLSALQYRPATSDSDSVRSLVNSGAPSRGHWETPATFDWTLGEEALPPVATVRSELSTSVHNSTRELRRALLDDICKEAGVRAEAKAREETRVWLLRETRRVITNVGRLCMASGAVLMTDTLPHGVLQSAALPSAALQSAMLPRVELLSTTLLQSAALLHGTRALLRALLRSAALLHGTPLHATLPPRLPHATVALCACRPPPKLHPDKLLVVQSLTGMPATSESAACRSLHSRKRHRSQTWCCQHTLPRTRRAAANDRKKTDEPTVFIQRDGFSHGVRWKQVSRLTRNIRHVG